MPAAIPIMIFIAAIQPLPQAVAKLKNLAPEILKQFKRFARVCRLLARRVISLRSGIWSAIGAQRTPAGLPPGRFMGSRPSPLDLRSLVNAAKTAEPGNVQQAFINEYGARIHEQEAELLHGLGINPSEPNVWRKAIRRLAMYDRGLGQISWPPRRPTNRNATGWTNEHNLGSGHWIFTSVSYWEGVAHRQTSERRFGLKRLFLAKSPNTTVT